MSSNLCYVKSKFLTIKDRIVAVRPDDGWHISVATWLLSEDNSITTTTDLHAEDPSNCVYPKSSVDDLLQRNSEFETLLNRRCGAKQAT